MLTSYDQATEPGGLPVFQDYPTDPLDATASDVTAAIDVSGIRTMSFQALQASGTWATAAVSIQCSNDGTNWVTRASTSLTAPGIIHSITVGTRYARLAITTTQAGAATITVIPSGKRG